MSISLSLTESQVFTALGNVLTQLLPSGVEVVKAQDNRVPEPDGPDFVSMNSTASQRLGTNVTTYADGYPTNPQVRQDLEPVQLTIQIDVHGPASADNAQILAQMLRSEAACDLFAAQPFDVTPLYASEPKQVPYLNAEQQIEQRWIVEAILQTNPVVTSPQDFTQSPKVGVVDVDEAFRP